MSDEKLLSFKSNGKCRYVTFLKIFGKCSLFIEKETVTSGFVACHSLDDAL